jgi:hypothetical protein
MVVLIVTTTKDLLLETQTGSFFDSNYDTTTLEQ